MKGDTAAGVADARHLVYERIPFAFSSAQRCVDVLDLEADVMSPPCPRRSCARACVGRSARDQLDHGLTDRIEREFHGLVLGIPRCRQADAEAVFPQPPARFGVPHHYADMSRYA